MNPKNWRQDLASRWKCLHFFRSRFVLYFQSMVWQFLHLRWIHVSSWVRRLYKNSAPIFCTAFSLYIVQIQNRGPNIGTKLVGTRKFHKILGYKLTNKKDLQIFVKQFRKVFKFILFFQFGSPVARNFPQRPC